MTNIGIFYGSSTGYTADVANRIAQRLNVAPTNVFDVAKTAPSKLGDFDVLILGSSTYGIGDLQTDWYDFLDGAEMLSLKGKKIALFGCGDESMDHSFCGALGEIYHRMSKTEADFIGEYNTEGFHFVESEGIDKATGMAYGLMLDEMNHPDMTQNRIDDWCKKVAEEVKVVTTA